MRTLIILFCIIGIVSPIVAEDFDPVTELQNSLMDAVVSRDVARVQTLSSIIDDLNFISESGSNPLRQACIFDNRWEVACCLLSAGADINFGGSNNWTALMTSASFGTIKCLTVLIQFGADPTIVNSNGKTALEIAKTSCLHSDEEYIQMLEEYTNNY